MQLSFDREDGIYHWSDFPLLANQLRAIADGVEGLSREHKARIGEDGPSVFLEQRLVEYGIVQMKGFLAAAERAVILGDGEDE